MLNRTTFKEKTDNTTRHIFLKYLCWRVWVAPIILALFLPLIQMRYQLLREPPLSGVVLSHHERPIFAWPDWFSGQYQQDFSAWFKEKIGFRPSFIRLDNQINFSCFSECNAYNEGIAVGKDNWLFERVYIHSLNNDDQVAMKVLENRIASLKKLQNLLNSNGIYLILVISPNKASICNEYVPDKYFRNGRTSLSANYSNAKQLFEDYNINYIDAHEYFAKHKQTSPYCLFVKGGTHWSNYGAALFCTEIVSKIKRDTELPMGSLLIAEVSVDNIPTDTDIDIANLMNVFDMRATYGETAHPVLTVDFPKNAIRPEILQVGSSFTHHLIIYMSDRIFGTRDFYYYYKNSQPWPYSEDRSTIPKGEDLKKVILSKQVILIEINEICLPRLGFGFIEDAVSVLDDADNKAPHEQNVTRPARLISPNGVSPQDVRFVWEHTEGSTWYQLWINDADGNCVYKKWYTDVDTLSLSGTECSIKPDILLKTGDYSWWIQSWVNEKKGPWSKEMTFSVH